MNTQNVILVIAIAGFALLAGMVIHENFNKDKDVDDEPTNNVEDQSTNMFVG